MTQLLQNAVYGTVMILAVAVLRGALRDRLLPEARLALWAVCLFRLFTPAAPASALSFWGLFSREAREIPVAGPAAPVVGPAAAPNVTAAPAAPAAPTVEGVPWGAVLTAVWIAVGAILAARYAMAYVRTCRAVNRTVPLGREDARYAALPKCVRLREGPLDGAPLTFGVVRPTVVLTPGLDGAELACVLAHEGVHARRRDNLWHCAAAAALTVFWWDPAVWLMARLIRRDVELSCDRAAVRRLGESKRAEYANALVTLSTQAEGGAFCHGFGPKRTEERIISIMKYKKATVTGIVLTLALVLAVTAGFASDPAADMPDGGSIASSAISDEEGTTSSSPAPLVWMCYSDPETEDKVLGGSISMDYLEVLLADHVADGSMTGEEAAFYLSEAEAMSQDGVKLDWKVPRDIELFTDGAAHRAGGQSGPYVYYMDGNGNKVYLDPVEMLTAYVFAPMDALSGSGLFVDSNEAEYDFVCYDSASDPNIILKEYKAVLDRAVAQGERTQAEADEMLARMEALIERAKKGEIEGLMFNRQASGEVMFVEEPDELTTVCMREDCPIQPSVHIHEADGSVTYIYSQPPVYSETETDDHGEKIVYCGFEDCTIQGEHFHHDPQGPEDSAKDIGGPVGCPPEAIDQNFFQNYPEANYQNFEHHESDHHGSDHHGSDHH